jgi:hypothetical protein
LPTSWQNLLYRKKITENPYNAKKKNKLGKTIALNRKIN